jgi:hypothetical protein
MNFFKKLKALITGYAIEVPVVSHVVFKVADHLDKKDEKAELKQRVLNHPMTVQVSEKSILTEGVVALKRKMRENMHIFGSGKRYEDGLDLIGYTPGQNEHRAQIMTQTSDLSGKDVKNTKEWDQMIDTRIGHYRQLQNDKLKRELIRSIRAEKDIILKKELLDKFEKKYGRR